MKREEKRRDDDDEKIMEGKRERRKNYNIEKERKKEKKRLKRERMKKNVYYLGKSNHQSAHFFPHAYRKKIIKSNKKRGVHFFFPLLFKKTLFFHLPFLFSVIIHFLTKNTHLF